MTSSLRTICLVLGFTATLPTLAAFAPAGTRSSRPADDRQATDLLATKCLPCHNGKTASGKVNFERRSDALSVLSPGDPESSRVVRVVTGGQMPPDSKLPVSDQETLRRWIANGAAYAREPLTPLRLVIKPLWSFRPIATPAVPRTPFDRLARDPIDRFVFDRLARNGLRPSPPARRHALLRRVTVDLTGLPPTPDEIAAFVNDPSPDAYEKVVDRLLASPAYGERWGRHWLDIVRFGESHGYEQNHVRPNAWPYRDYVIRAFNEDRPYARFIAEQLAGDVVGKGDPQLEPATGFLVAGIHDTVGIQTEEGTRQQRSNDLDDMVSTTGAAFLGLTIGCARCHDHKFDPIPQNDYYRLTAVFAGVRHAERPLTTRRLTDPERAELDRLTDEIARRNNEKAEIEATARERLEARRRTAGVTRPAVNARRNVDEFDPVPARFVRFVVLATNDGAEPNLDELRIYGDDADRNLALASVGAKATASSLLPGYPIHQIPHLNDGVAGNDRSWISNERGAGWARIELPATMVVRRVVWSRDGGDNPRFDDRLATAYRIEVSEDGVRWTTVSTEKGRAPLATTAYADILAAMTPSERQRIEAIETARTDLRRRADTLNPVRNAYTGHFTEPDPIHLLRRGDVMQRGDEVTPGGLSQVRQMPSDLLADPNAPEPERRLALARWIADPRNPLTARVLVNRLWQHHFGRGLVNTPSDFGNNGEKPSHPELLDYLASDFLKNGGRIKRMHRRMVLSYTYRQSSDAVPQAMAKDAGNVLLWRMPLRRMEAEAVRDAILLASGKLDRRQGGPGYPLFRYRVVNVAIYEPLEEYGPETWRRSVYQQNARAIRDPLLGAFDCPESSQRAPRRESTTTALQSLALLNGTFVTQQAGFLAERVRREAGASPVVQAQKAFRRTFGRDPMPGERDGAIALIRAGNLPGLCRALLNANEFLYY
ncbi:MAG: DUF1553 domain-containing protein [Capsulimonadales bacterium]|nr:DUF1553 domain-containing protein [Capsulimonadales bacterium]